MSRLGTLRHVTIAIPFLVLYVVVLFPAVFVLTIAAGILDFGYRLVTGSDDGTRLTDWSARLWAWNGSNAQHALSADDEFELLP